MAPLQINNTWKRVMGYFYEVFSASLKTVMEYRLSDNKSAMQGCISCGPCSCPELTEDHVLPSAYVEIFRTVTRNAVNKSF